MAYYPRLRDMREDHDMTQRQLAARLGMAAPNASILAKRRGMAQPQYSRYEQGLRDIPTPVLIQLARLYDTTTDYLLGLTNDPRKP